MEITTLPEPILVGRKNEIEKLKLFLNSVFRGKGKTVFVSGKAGSGKSRLINEFLRMVKEKEITILFGFCLSNASLPYFPFIEAFDSNLFRRDSGALIEQQLHRGSWISESFSTGQIDKNRTVAPQIWKDQTFAAVSRELLFLSSVKPMILILEDMHWADSASLALLHYISRVISNEKILVLASFRSEELGRDAEGYRHPLVETIQLMGREGLFKDIKLTNLNKDNVRDIAESMLDGKVSQELVDRLGQESLGNPLFVVEFLRMLSEEKSLIKENNQWQLSVDKLGIPSKVKDIIVRRIDSLKPEERRILDIASVIGEKFYPDLIGAVLSKGHLEILESLNRILKSTSLVRVEGQQFRFDHAKSQEVLYEEITSPLKQEYHKRIAEQIEKSNHSKNYSLNDLAYHYAQAGNKEKSLKYSLEAGQDALDRFSNSEAINHFNSVLKLVAKSDEFTAERNIALEGLGDAYIANCMYEEAIKTFSQLAEVETGSLKLRALRKAMDAAFIKGDRPDILLSFAKKAEKLALNDRLEMARIIKNRGRAFAWAGRGERKQDLEDYETALKIFEEENSPEDVAEALWRSGEVQIIAKEIYQKGLGRLLLSRCIFKDLGDVRKEIAVSRSIGNAFINLGLFSEAKQELNNVLEVGEKLGVFNELARAKGILGFIDENEGNLEKALSEVLSAINYIEKTDVNYVLAFDLGALTRLYSKLGNLKLANEYFEKMVNLPPEVLSTGLVRINLTLSKGVYYTAKGKFREANKMLEDFGSILFASPLFFKDYIWILEKQGRTEEIKIQKEMFQKFLEQTRKWFEHSNIHLSILVPRAVHIKEIFEMRIDLVNIGNSWGTLLKIEGLIPDGCKIVSLPSLCSIQNHSIMLTNLTIEPFKVETIKIKVLLEEEGVYTLYPKINYTNDLGESKIEKTDQITIIAQLRSDEEKRKITVNPQTRKIEFKYKVAEKTFDFLVKAFIEDYFVKRFSKENSGWRTRMEVVRDAKVTMYSLYGRSGRGGKAILELNDLGLVESRFFLGERGRGGEVFKMRVFPEKEPVAKRINQKRLS